MPDEYDLGFVYKQENDKGLKVTLSCFRGNWYVHLREYIYDGDEDHWFPTKKGIAVKAEYIDLVASKFAEAGSIATEEFYNSLSELIKKEEDNNDSKSME